MLNPHPVRLRKSSSATPPTSSQKSRPRAHSNATAPSRITQTHESLQSEQYLGPSELYAQFPGPPQASPTKEAPPQASSSATRSPPPTRPMKNREKQPQGEYSGPSEQYAQFPGPRETSKFKAHTSKSAKSRPTSTHLTPELPIRRPMSPPARPGQYMGPSELYAQFPDPPSTPAPSTPIPSASVPPKIPPRNPARNSDSKPPRQPKSSKRPSTATGVSPFRSKSLAVQPDKSETASLHSAHNVWDTLLQRRRSTDGHAGKDASARPPMSPVREKKRASTLDYVSDIPIPTAMGHSVAWSANLSFPAQRSPTTASRTLASNHTSTSGLHSPRSTTATPNSPRSASAQRSSMKVSATKPIAPSVRKALQAAPKARSQSNKFSTLDQTILAELRRTLEARASQFVLKGPPSQQQKHHPYKTGEVPYPRSYSREAVDLDVWETVFCRQLCGSPTWHVFEEGETPKRVLDIGCGTGAWILDCARMWKDAHFVGLDIVPLHSDLRQVGSADLAARVTWVQDNFLERLPFPNEEFDFVHIKRIARGVPEDKWDGLLEEITRVMRPGAAFEMIEEDLDFPGKSPSTDEDADGHSDPETDLETKADTDTMASHSPGLSYSRPRASSPSPPFSYSDADESDLELNPSPNRHFSENASPDDVSRTDFPPTPPRSLSPSPPSAPSPQPMAIEDVDQMSTIAETGDDSQQHTPRRPLTPKNEPQFDGSSEGGSSREPPPRPMAPEPTTPKSGRPTSLRIQTQPSQPQWLTNVGRGLPNTSPQSMQRPRASTSSSQLSSDSASMLPSSSVAQKLYALSPTASRPSLTSPSRPPVLRSRSHSHAQLLQTQTQRHAPDLSLSTTAFSPTTVDFAPLSKSTSLGATGLTTPFLLRPVGKQPRNPRDHALLELIYVEMHAARFINLAPLSLLANSLSTYFKDVRTHPPLVLTFPPLPHKCSTAEQQRYSWPSSSSSDPPSDLDEFMNTPRAADTPRTNSSDSMPKDNGSNDAAEKSHFVSLEGLLLGASPYVSLDTSRMSALSPSARPLPSVAMVTEPQSGMDVTSADHSALSALKMRLPNTKLNFDLRTLNLHLAVRASEVVACAESMWEWVLEYQAQERRHHSGQSGDPLKAEIASMTRTEFDSLVTRFDLDMRDHMGLGSAIENRSGWSISPSAKTQDRKTFDNDCAKWAQHVRDKHRADAYRHPYRHTSDRSGPELSGSTRNATAISPTSIRSASTKTSTRHRRAKTESQMLTPEPSISGEASSIAMPSPSRRLCRTMRVFVAWKA